MSESGQIVLIGPGHLFNQTLEAQTFEDSRNLSAGFFWQMALKMLFLKAGNIEFAAYNGLKQILVLVIKEIKTAVSPLIVESSAGNLIEMTHPLAWVMDGGDKFEVAMVGRSKNALKRMQAVDALFHGRPSHGKAAIAMFYLTVVFEKGDVTEGKADAFFTEPGRQPSMTIEVDLQPERTPRRNTNVAKPEFLIDKVEVIMQAFCQIGLEIGRTGFLAVHWFVRLTGFHGRQNVNQFRMPAAFLENAFDQFLLAGAVTANKLYSQAIFSRQFLSVYPDRISKRLGKMRVIENANVVSIQITRPDQ
jgi:hypothetical protein